MGLCDKIFSPFDLWECCDIFRLNFFKMWGSRMFGPSPYEIHIKFILNLGLWDFQLLTLWECRDTFKLNLFECGAPGPLAPCHVKNGVIDSNYENAMIHYIQINFVCRAQGPLAPSPWENILIKFLLDVVLQNPCIYLNLYLILQI